MQQINFYRQRVAINVLAKDIANAKAIYEAAEGDAPRDKCAPFREINGIAAAFQYSQKNYNPTASSFL